ncbi:DsbA family protein [Lichenihabitans sp. Uapishka_5]|uniref:DsbA family protein n=1 Tax=Lichenihabitans sp. Uapishka_5 TaxID=3037302 RepID=UPI0029E81C03|nr:DsbA family protein [Lichenihabitans sp. Uapishka_5]MDX7950173.1 DsbA family protein [Lichenihabitans sp. Uapishka_5]
MFFLEPSRRTRRWLAAAATGAALLAMTPATQAAEFNPAQKAEIGALVKDYLVQNPEVLRDAMVELDKRDKAQEAAKRETIMRDQSDALLNSPYGEVVGNPNGKVTLVEFFDYNCGYCKRALDDMAKLMKTTPDMRVVLRDFPVLGPGSVEAAQVAGAVRTQLNGDKFWAFHYKLLSTHGPVAKAQALAAAKDSGVDMDQLTKDLAKPEIKAGIQQSLQLADALSLTGTPSFVVGSDVVVGAVGYDELKEHVDNVAKCGKSTCS